MCSKKKQRLAHATYAAVFLYLPPAILFSAERGTVDNLGSMMDGATGGTTETTGTPGT